MSELVENSLAEIQSILAKLSPEVRAQVLAEVLRRSATEADHFSEPRRVFRLSHGCFAAFLGRAQDWVLL